MSKRDEEEWALRKVALAFALALADAYFGFADANGRRVVPLDQAHVFAAARTDLWELWPRVPRRVREMAGDYWHVRPPELADKMEFHQLARWWASHPDSLYLLPPDVAPRKAEFLLVAHAQRPLVLARGLLREAEEIYYGSRSPQPAATAGNWSFGKDSVVTIPDGEGEADITPLRVRTAPYRDEVVLSRRRVLRLVGQQAAASERNSWKPGLAGRFFGRLLDSEDRKVTRLRMPAGRLTVVSAPTGVGKSVLLRAAAPLLARHRTGPVAVVVGQIHESLSNAEHIREAEVELTGHALAEQIQRDDDLVRKTAAEFAAAYPTLKVVPLVSGYRLAEQAERALVQGREQRFEELAYGCDLSTWLIDGEPVRRGAEPCLSLRPADDTGDGEGPSRGYACPRLGVCGKYALIREAVDADVIVTNHHNLLGGAVPVPVETDKGVLDRISLLEFLMRRCSVLLVDEVDRMQQTWCEMGSDEFTLASRGFHGSSLLVEVDRQREVLDAATDRRLVPVLFKTRSLGEQFLNYVLEGDLWLDPAEHDDDDRLNSGWHVPGAWDRWLLDKLLHVDVTQPVDQDVYREFRKIFPDRRKKKKNPRRLVTLTSPRCWTRLSAATPATTRCPR